MKRDFPVSVLAHLFLVFSFSYILSSLKGFSEKDMEIILVKSLLHDIPEAFTGDVITPTKKAVAGFIEILEKIEEDLIEKNIIAYFKKYNFSKELKKSMLDTFSDDVGKIAKYSDHLSAMFEAKIESDKDFVRIYYDIKKYLWSLKDNELDYVLKYGVDYFDEDIETKWKKFIGLN